MWFRQDLRLDDNKALYNVFHNLNDEDEVLLIFQVNPKQFINQSYNHDAFFSSVKKFRTDLNTQGHLQIIYGDPIESFKTLKKSVSDWNKIYFNEDTSGYGAKRDLIAIEFFKENKISFHSYQDNYLHGVKEIKKENGEDYKVFTPYYRKWIELTKETPLKVKFNKSKIYSEVLFPTDEQKFDQLLKKINHPFDKVGSETAIQSMKKFINNDICEYHKSRDIPSLDKTSHLSNYLRTGELSIRTLWNEIEKQNYSEGKETFKKELCWREFYNMIYTNYPNQKETPIKEQFMFIEWENSQEKFEAWKKGETGYPIIDAAMRQLLKSGWMHNRLRMIVSSFLVKDLLIDWRWGEKYFQKMLIDYDPASNIGGWQWAASTGTDAAPYFRIFNPTTQAQKFDPDGKYISKYVPELVNLPQNYIHQPDKLSKDQQQKYKMFLGETYPYPIVNHKERRKNAILEFESSKSKYRSEQ